MNNLTFIIENNLPISLSYMALSINCFNYCFLLLPIFIESICYLKNNNLNYDINLYSNLNSYNDNNNFYNLVNGFNNISINNYTNYGFVASTDISCDSNNNCYLHTTLTLGINNYLINNGSSIILQCFNFLLCNYNKSFCITDIH